MEPLSNVSPGWTFSDLEFLSKLQDETKHIRTIVHDNLSSIQDDHFKNQLEDELKKFDTLYNRFEELNRNKPKNKAFVAGQTKSGKSTLSNGLIGKKFFIVSATSETYTGWRLTPSPNSNYHIVVSYLEETGMTPLEKEMKTATEFEHETKTYTRVSYRDEKGESAWKKIKHIELQAPISQVRLLSNTELWDTAGVSEVAMKEQLLLSIRKYFAESTVICVCSLESGSIELSDYEEILRSFYGDNTKKIIFVFTKLGQAIMSEEAKASDPDVPDEKILDEVNKTIRTGFVEPVKRHYPKAKMVIYDVTKRSYNQVYYHKESLVVTRNPSADTVPVWNVDHLQKLLETEAQENNKSFCEQFHSALLSQANSTLAVIISYFTSNGALNLLKLKYQEKVDTYKGQCKRDFQAWIKQGADIKPLLDEFDKSDSYRFRQDTYANDLILHIQSFLSQKIQNKVLSLCENYTNQLCKDLIDELKSNSQYIQNNSFIADGMSPISILGVAAGTFGGLVAGGTYFTFLATLLGATGFGLIVGAFFITLSTLAGWSRAGVKETLVSSVTSHLNTYVEKPVSLHFDTHFKDVGEKIENYLTILFTGVEETNLLKRELIYNQVKSQISVIKLMKQ